MKEIIKKCKCGVTLSINEHRNYYLTVKKRIKEINEIDFSCNGEHEDYEPEIDKDLAERLIEADAIYELRFYPNTPIGFYTVYGASLYEVINEAKKILNNL